MNLKQLRSFVAVYEEGSFSRAAVREGITQPGLSTQVQNLEASLSASLFERSVHGVTPTPAGQHLYGHAVEILHSVRSAAQEIAEMEREVSGTIRVGLIPSAVRGYLPTLLPKFVERYPLVEISIVEGYSGVLTAWMRDRNLDFSVLINPPKQEGVKVTKLVEERLVLVSSPALGLEPWRPLALGDLEPMNLVVPSPRNSLRQIMDRCIRTGELKVGRVVEMDAMQGSVEFVKNAPWATLLPFSAIYYELECPSLCFNPIADPIIRADFYLVHQTQRPLSKAAEAFVGVLREEASTLLAEWARYAGSG